MDINCTNSCKYQQDGKCTLTELNSFTQVMDENVDCAYYYPAT